MRSGVFRENGGERVIPHHHNLYLIISTLYLYYLPTFNLRFVINLYHRPKELI